MYYKKNYKLVYKIILRLNLNNNYNKKLKFPKILLKCHYKKYAKTNFCERIAIIIY